MDSTLETLNAAIKLQTDAQEILAAAQENADTTQTNLDASTFAHDSEEYLALLQAVSGVELQEPGEFVSLISDLL